MRTHHDKSNVEESHLQENPGVDTMEGECMVGDDS